MTAVPAIVEPPPSVATGGRPGGGRVGRGVAVALFMGPAAALLGAIVGYPTVATAIRSLYDKTGDTFVGLGNYRTLFSTTDTLVAIRNNAIWVIVFPFLVTFIGLLFAVLTERIRWVTAFRTIVFMPMAISLFATGVIWRIVYEADPHRGVVNSAVGAVVDAVRQPGLYALPNVKPVSGLAARSDGSVVSSQAVQPGGSVQLGLTGITPEDIPPGAQPAHPATPRTGAVTGIVWHDFSPGGRIGVVDRGEKGLPAMRVDLMRSNDGSSVATTSTDAGGAFTFGNVPAGTYRVAVDASNFRPPFQGINWLGPQSLTPTGGLGEVGRALLSVPLVDIAEITAMLWMWSGFAMVVIGAGLAALNREVLEAAKIDGASEWQTFRHITLPLLRPVLVVVFITMVINVLKIFDIVLSLTPDSSQQQANVIALEMWRLGFTGSGDFGLSSAVAVFLFVLVVPVMVLNVRRIRG